MITRETAIMDELKELIGRFGLSVGQLKTSPDYEAEMILKMAMKELPKDTIAQLERRLVGSFKGIADKAPGRSKTKKWVIEVETGTIKTLSGWTEYYSCNKIFYKKLSREGLNELSYNGKTYRRNGEWSL